MSLSKDEVFENETDPQFLNKVRFALPTVEIVISFNPVIREVLEKLYRDFKVEMLNWAFCRASIMSPPAVVSKIKGSAAQAELFLHALKPLKERFISRKQEVKLLGGDEEVSEKDENEVPGAKKKASTPEEHA